jgi:7-cyano-7-deazaguanine synthase
MRDTLLLLSGGLDSVVLAEQLRQAGRLVAAVHFVYPHPAQFAERRVVQRLSTRWHRQRAAVRVIEEPLHLRAFELAIGIGVAGTRLVPARNLAMLAMAANMAPSLGATRIVFGATAEDASGYPDCRADYVAAVSRLLEPFGVTVDAPFALVRRDEIRAMATGFGLDADDSWSCYQPLDGEPCGTCNSCRQDDSMVPA